MAIFAPSCEVFAVGGEIEGIDCVLVLEDGEEGF